MKPLWRSAAWAAGAAALSLALTILLLRSVGVNSLVETYRNLRLSVAGLFPLLWLAAGVARAAIYHRLLSARVRILELMPLMWVRGLVIDLVPARAGLAVIPAALRLVWGIGVSEGFGVLAGVTVVEFASLGILVVVVGAASLAPELPIMRTLLLVGGAGLVALLPLALVVADRIKSLQRFGKAGATVARIAGAVTVLAERRLLLSVMIWSFLTRLAKYGGLYVLLLAMPVPRLEPFSFLVAALAAEATTTLPFQGLAGIGTWEAAWAASTTAFGFTTQEAVASAFGLHLSVLGLEIVMGGMGLILLAVLRRRDS